ncbi:MAG: CDP-alcohol phosphatidyltransferase family protein [Alphaproteobacteria bacterium]|nr:CDP-alcohol phosphatidyltransferase family protein [Alphaproteobacteria bacterium]
MNYPNLISMARLLSVPVLIWLLLSRHLVAAFWVFCGAGASDFLDGLLARLLKERTELGAYLDPLADKALLVGTFVTLGVLGFIPLWLVIMVVSRDVLIIAGSLLMILFDKPLRVEPLFISKINTTVQILLVCVLLGLAALDRSYPLFCEGLFWLAGVTTLLSGASYVKLWLQMMGGNAHERL